MMSDNCFKKLQKRKVVYIKCTSLESFVSSIHVPFMLCVLPLFFKPPLCTKHVLVSWKRTYTQKKVCI